MTTPHLVGLLLTHSQFFIIGISNIVQYFQNSICMPGTIGALYINRTSDVIDGFDKTKPVVYSVGFFYFLHLFISGLLRVCKFSECLGFFCNYLELFLAQTMLSGNHNQQFVVCSLYDCSLTVSARPTTWRSTRSRWTSWPPLWRKGARRTWTRPSVV